MSRDLREPPQAETLTTHQDDARIYAEESVERSYVRGRKDTQIPIILEVDGNDIARLIESGHVCLEPDEGFENSCKDQGKVATWLSSMTETGSLFVSGFCDNHKNLRRLTTPDFSYKKHKKYLQSAHPEVSVSRAVGSRTPIGRGINKSSAPSI